MKQLLLLLILVFLLGAAPTRSDEYISGQTIDPTAVTRNEDAIFTYLQNGVDTLANNSVTSANIVDETIVSGDINDGTIVNADINASAAIASSKLDLPSPTITVTITKPLDLTEADTLPIWVNRTGRTFTITAIYSNSDVDDVNFTLKEVTDHTDFTALITIEAITISTNGTNVFYNDLTSGIDHTTIESGNLIVFDNDATDDPAYINFTIVGSN